MREKLNLFRVHSTPIYSPVAHFIRNVGYRKHNSYRVATPHNAFVMFAYSADNLSGNPPCMAVFWNFVHILLIIICRFPLLIWVVWGLLWYISQTIFMQFSPWNWAVWSSVVWHCAKIPLMICFWRQEYGQLGTGDGTEKPHVGEWNEHESSCARINQYGFSLSPFVLQ